MPRPVDWSRLVLPLAHQPTGRKTWAARRRTVGQASGADALRRPFGHAGPPVDPGMLHKLILMGKPLRVDEKRWRVINREHSCRCANIIFSPADSPTRVGKARRFIQRKPQRAESSGRYAGCGDDWLLCSRLSSGPVIRLPRQRFEIGLVPVRSVSILRNIAAPGSLHHTCKRRDAWAAVETNNLRSCTVHPFHDLTIADCRLHLL